MDIFQFNDYRSYLTEVRKQYPGVNKALSLDEWAKRLGYKSPRSIAMVLKGQRLLTTEMLLAIATDLKLSNNERRYLELLIQKEKYQTKGNVPAAIIAELESFQTMKASRKELNSEFFAYIFQWHFLALKQLIASGKCKYDIAWIRKKLNNKASEGEITTALDVLQKLNLVQVDFKNAKLILAEDTSCITKPDIPSRYAQEHLKQQMQRAMEALEEQGIMDREFTSITVRVDRKKLNNIKKFIRDFRDKFDTEFYNKDSSEVGQLNVQFFFHTKEI